MEAGTGTGTGRCRHPASGAEPTLGLQKGLPGRMS